MKNINDYLNDSYIWLIAAVLQLVTNIMLSSGKVDPGLNLGRAAGGAWILAALVHGGVTPGHAKTPIEYLKRFFSPALLLIGGILFLASYLIPVPLDDAQKTAEALRNIDVVALAGAACFFLAASITVFRSLKLSGNSWLVKYGAACFAVGAGAVIAQQILKLANVQMPDEVAKGLSIGSAVPLVIGALVWTVMFGKGLREKPVSTKSQTLLSENSKGRAAASTKSMGSLRSAPSSGAQGVVTATL